MTVKDPVAVLEPKSGAARPGRGDATGAEIPVTVHASRTSQSLGENLPSVHEDTKTVIVLQQGAVIRLTATLMAGETIVLTNRMTGADVLCRVGNVKSQPGIQHYVDLEFIQRAPGFWGDSTAASSAPIAADLPAVALAPPEPVAALVAVLPPFPPGSVSARPPATVAVAAPPMPPLVAPPPSPVANLPPAAATKALELVPLAEPGDVLRKAPQDSSVTPIRSGVNQLTFSPITAESESNRTSGSHKALLATAAAVLLVLCGAAGGYWLYGQQSVAGPLVPQQAVNVPPVQAAPDPAAAEDFLVSDPLPAEVSAPEPESQMDIVIETRPTVDVSSARVAPLPKPAPVRAPAPVVRNTVPIGQLQAPKTKTTATRFDASSPPLVIVGAVNLGDTGAVNSLLVAEPAGPAPPPINPQKAIGGQLQPPQIINAPAPVYPPSARMQRLQGVVVLDVLVDETGKVAEAKVASGPPLLLSAAQQAVRNWKYKPAQLNGKPIAMHTTVSVRFNLQ